MEHNSVLKLTGNETLVIRETGADDVPVILELIKELADFEKMSQYVEADEEILKENLFGERRYAEVLLAEINGKAVGQALFFHNFSTFVGRPGIYLEDLYVKPEYRGKGIGKALLLKVIETAKERKCGRVEWVVLDWNTEAMEFYKSLGAEPKNEWIIFRLDSSKF